MVFDRKQILGLEALSRKNKCKSKDKIIFSDRGLGDTIAYYKVHKLGIPKHILDYALKFRYKKVFIFDFLDFYEQDSLRQETKREQVKIHNTIIQTYEKLGYTPIIVPSMSVAERVRFIKKIAL